MNCFINCCKVEITRSFSLQVLLWFHLSACKDRLDSVFYGRFIFYRNSYIETSFHCIIIKLCENVCWQNISAKFDTQPDPMKHFGVMALELAQFAKINCVWSVTWIFLNGSASNFVTLFVGTISWPSSTTSQILWKTCELWPLN